MKPTTFALGILSLIALEVLVTTPLSGYLGDLIQVPAEILKKLIDPSVPLIKGKGTETSPTPAGILGPYTSGKVIPPLVPSAQTMLGR